MYVTVCLFLRIVSGKQTYNFFIFLGRSRGQVPFANLAGGGREGAEDDHRGDGPARSSPPPVSFSDIMTVFQRAVREVRAGQSALENGEAKGGDSTYFNR